VSKDLMNVISKLWTEDVRECEFSVDVF
jgi:hypothetical protein